MSETINTEVTESYKSIERFEVGKNYYHSVVGFFKVLDIHSDYISVISSPVYEDTIDEKMNEILDKYKNKRLRYRFLRDLGLSVKISICISERYVKWHQPDLSILGESLEVHT